MKSWRRDIDNWEITMAALVPKYIFNEKSPSTLASLFITQKCFELKWVKAGQVSGSRFTIHCLLSYTI
jgi:hypothetical protein